jgi:uncharacterized protein YegL
MADDIFPAVDLEPPEDTITRNLVVLLLDASASMREVDADSSDGSRGTTKMTALRSALDVFLAADVHNEAKLEANGELAILSFGNGAVTSLDLGTPVAPGSPFHFIRYVRSAPVFSFDGNTPMGAAIARALQIIDARKDSLADSGITHEFRPNIFLLTDGKPNDAPGVLERAVEQLHAEEANNGVLLWVLGTCDASRPVLTRIANKGNYLDLPGNSLAQFLKFVSKSMRRQAGLRQQDDAQSIYQDVKRSISFDQAVDDLLAHG